jgi:imidazolonepropionase-like amidohydrolase
VLAGTDAGGVLPHGLVAQEILAMHAAGIPAEAALAAGSWSARAYLGLPGLAEGAPADFVVYPDRPAAPTSRVAGHARRGSSCAAPVVR